MLVDLSHPEEVVVRRVLFFYGDKLYRDELYRKPMTGVAQFMYTPRPFDFKPKWFSERDSPEYETLTVDEWELVAFEGRNGIAHYELCPADNDTLDWLYKRNPDYIRPDYRKQELEYVPFHQERKRR